jgi:hypothetical protein
MESLKEYKIAEETAEKMFKFLRTQLVDNMYLKGLITSSDDEGYVDLHHKLLEQTISKLSELNDLDLKRRSAVDK